MFWNRLSLIFLAFACSLQTFTLSCQVYNRANPPKPKKIHSREFSVTLDEYWCHRAMVLTHIKIPNLENTNQLLDECTVEPLAVSTSIGIFYEEWSRRFGDRDLEVHNMVNNLLIQWADKKRTVHAAYDMHGQYKENVTVSGLALSRNHIWVRRGKKGIGTSSLVHELVHLALWAQYDSPDPTHEGGDDDLWKKEHTQFIKDVNLLLFSIGDRKLADANYINESLREEMESALGDETK